MKRVECHVFAGLGGNLFAFGTRSLDRLLDELAKEWDANHWLHGQWEKVCDDIIARHKRHNNAPNVILIGHSYGALRCQQIASRLRQNGIAVDLICGIDPTALLPWHDKMVIPHEVKRVVEFYATSGIPASARRRSPDGSSGGMYVYPVNWRGTNELVIVPGGHIPCASNPITVNKIMSEVRAVI